MTPLKDAILHEERDNLVVRSISFLLLISLVAGCEAPPFSSDRHNQAGDQILRHVADIPLPGDPTRFDYQSLDPTTGRLYLSHMGDGTVVVFDTRTNQVVAQATGFPRVTGVLVVPPLKRLYASVIQNHEIAVLDTEMLQVIKRIPDGKFPDGLAWSPETHKIFVSDESGEAETVIDTDRDERVATIPMGGEVGNTQHDPSSHLIYACVQTRNELVAIDPASNAIVARYPLKDGRHPHGLFIDNVHRLAYIACQGNSKLLVFNLGTHQVECRLPVGLIPDVLAFDCGLGILYVASELGPVSVFRYIEQDHKLVKQGNVDVGGNAHTVSVDPATHKVYFPLKSVRGKPMLRIMLPGNSKTEA